MERRESVPLFDTSRGVTNRPAYLPSVFLFFFLAFPRKASSVFSTSRLEPCKQYAPLVTGMCALNNVVILMPLLYFKLAHYFFSNPPSLFQLFGVCFSLFFFFPRRSRFSTMIIAAICFSFFCVVMCLSLRHVVARLVMLV